MVDSRGRDAPARSPSLPGPVGSRTPSLLQIPIGRTVLHADMASPCEAAEAPRQAALAGRRRSKAGGLCSLFLSPVPLCGPDCQAVNIIRRKHLGGADHFGTRRNQLGAEEHPGGQAPTLSVAVRNRATFAALALSANDPYSRAVRREYQSLCWNPYLFAPNLWLSFRREIGPEFRRHRHPTLGNALEPKAEDLRHPGLVSALQSGSRYSRAAVLPPVRQDQTTAPEFRCRIAKRRNNALR